MSETRNKCSECRFRRSIPGDGQINCALSDHLGINPFEILFARGFPGVEVSPQGNSAWKMWPISFDPRWITCTREEAKTE